MCDVEENKSGWGSGGPGLGPGTVPNLLCVTLTGVLPSLGLHVLQCRMDHIIDSQQEQKPPPQPWEASGS